MATLGDFMKVVRRRIGLSRPALRRAVDLVREHEMATGTLIWLVFCAEALKLLLFPQ